MRKPTYLEWEHILLDTSIIISYLNAHRNEKDERCAFVKRIVDDLNSNKNSDSKARKLYISSITVAELYDKSDDIKKTEKIVKSLNVKDVSFIAFDSDLAEHMTSTYHSVLGTDKLKQIARDLSFPENDLLHGRQWIEKDTMILATCDYLACDVVLTTDKKTMLPMAEKLDIYCAVIEKENFNHNNTYIFDYQPGFGKSTQ